MPETLAFIRKIRETVGPDAFLCGEVSSQTYPISAEERIVSYMRAGLDCGYTLGLIRKEVLHPSMFCAMYEAVADNPDTPTTAICWARQCHDEARRVHDAQTAAFYHLLSLILPGHNCVFYGEELGLLNDPSLMDDDSYKRGPVRRLMTWGAPVEKQQNDPNSFLRRYTAHNLYWNRNRDFLGSSAAEVRELDGHPDVLIVTRHNAHKSIQYIFNASDKVLTIDYSDLAPFYIDGGNIRDTSSNTNPIEGHKVLVPSISVVSLEGPALGKVPEPSLQSRPVSARGRLTTLEPA